MKRCFLIFLFGIIFGLPVMLAQNYTSIEETQDAVANYFSLPRESVYLHLNKSSYIVGEEIWFKAYLYNRAQENAFEQTSNLYVGIYDSLGKQIKKNLYLAEDGFSKGSLVVDSTFTNGTYYIKASTNWMKNFREDDSYVQKIKIFKNSPKNKKVTGNLDYDIQLLPEGGNLIADVVNTVGVKILDQNGYGVKIIEGIVRDGSGLKVTQFETTKYGLAKFNILSKLSRDYYVTIRFKGGEEKTLKLPKPERQGIAIGVEKKGNERLIVFLSTNAQTLDKIKDKKFMLLIHKDGKNQSIDVNFNQENLMYSFLIDRSSLYKGINIITLLDESGAPVLERLYFNDYNMEFPEVNISASKPVNDSVSISLEVLSNTNSTRNLSVSVLPKNTIAYQQTNNILSTFHLKPYVKGFIENPSYYFTNFDAKKAIELDLLLLTQGWSRYKWRLIVKWPPRQTHDFEVGMDLVGTLNSKVEFGDKVILFPSGGMPSQILDIYQNKFKVPNMVLRDKETIEVALLKNNDKLVKPNIYVNVLNNTNKIDEIEEVWDENYNISYTPSALQNLSSFINPEGAIELYEVKLTGKKKTEAEKNIYVPGFLKGKVKVVTEDMAFNFPVVTDLIRARGYYVREELQFGTTNRVTIRVKTIQSILGDQFPSPIIYVDDMVLKDFDFLYQFPTKDIESFYIDKTGGGEGTRGSGGVIRIYTRRGSNPLGGDEPNIRQSTQVTVNSGFQRVKEFYTPNYRTYFDEAFEQLGVIHWDPEVITDASGKASFKILNTTLKDLSFFIEGISENGSLISTAQTIQLN